MILLGRVSVKVISLSYFNNEIQQNNTPLPPRFLSTTPSLCGGPPPHLPREVVPPFAGPLPRLHLASPVLETSPHLTLTPALQHPHLPPLRVPAEVPLLAHQLGLSLGPAPPLAARAGPPGAPPPGPPHQGALRAAGVELRQPQAGQHVGVVLFARQLCQGALVDINK